tara:strand:- start:31679 stop:31876 length:198 start_codon:yes stop_codon:yes gene_type:complete
MARLLSSLGAERSCALISLKRTAGGRCIRHFDRRNRYPLPIGMGDGKEAQSQGCRSLRHMVTATA